MHWHDSSAHELRSDRPPREKHAKQKLKSYKGSSSGLLAYVSNALYDAFTFPSRGSSLTECLRGEWYNCMPHGAVGSDEESPSYIGTEYSQHGLANSRPDRQCD